VRVKRRVASFNQIKTLQACPSQWVGLLEGGEHFYARYRWGVFAIGVGIDQVSAMQASMHEPIFSARLGDDHDGVLETLELKRISSLIFDWRGARET
jgi:hypothetical protein